MMKRFACMLAAMLLLITLLPLTAMATANPVPAANPTLIWNGSTMTGKNGVTVSGKTFTIKKDCKLSVMNNSADTIRIYYNNKSASEFDKPSSGSVSTSPYTLEPGTYEYHTFDIGLGTFLYLNYYRTKTSSKVLYLNEESTALTVDVYPNHGSITKDDISSIRLTSFNGSSLTITTLKPGSGLSVANFGNGVRFTFTADAVKGLKQKCGACNCLLEVEVFVEIDSNVSSNKMSCSKAAVNLTINDSRPVAPATGDSMPLTAIALLMAACIVVAACLKARKVEA